MPDAGYTIRNRQTHDRSARVQEIGVPTRFNLTSIDATPATPSVPPAPCGDLSTADVDEIVAHAIPLGSVADSTRKKRTTGLRAVLTFLGTFPGATWQERWLASGLDDSDEAAWRVVPISPSGRTACVLAVQALFHMRVVQPSLVAFRSNLHDKRGYALTFCATQQDEGLTRFYAEVETSEAAPRFHDFARFDIATLMTTQGVAFVDITPSAVMHYVTECRRHGLAPGDKQRRGQFAGVLAWETLMKMGHFPPDTPSALRTGLYRGQLTTEEMIDRYEIRSASVRQLLVDYILRREQNTDYNTRSGLALQLAGNFWSKIERIAPDQQDLRLPEHVYEQWREEIRLRNDGKPRMNLDGVLLPVRALYLDIQSWAIAEPERWGPWVAPCPVPQSDLRGHAKRRRKIKERMDERTRVRQPLLPHLVAHVQDRLSLMSGLLAATRAQDPGTTFTHQGVVYERTDSPFDRLNRRRGDDPVRVTNTLTGEVVDLRKDEEQAFWEWAYVEVLRHSGIRVEELVELSHTSLRQYRRPNGELVALLIVAPSKTDRERVIPCSAELFHVLALVVRRQMQHGPIHVIERYDPHERQMTPPLPYLFQRRVGSVRRVTSPGTVVDILQRACVRTAQSVPAMRDVQFTPHDFRRLFATELMGNGLPIHIGAALLGHLNIETTRGYTAVFADEVIQQYQRFLNNRREMRSKDEYRPATDEEWKEFEEHFDKRKVELGSCGRPYGTPCQHEHACIRCPVLHVNPKMLHRLDELEQDLLERIERANLEGWTGEIEGLTITLNLLRAKQEETTRMTRTTERVALGMPQVGDPFGR